MTIHPELLAMMKWADYYPYTGQDAAGNNTYGSLKTILVHPEQPSQTMQTSAGDSGTTVPDTEEQAVFLADYLDPGVTVKGRLVFRDIDYRIVTVKTVDDENGPYYQELTCSTNKER